jgi:D-alanyl-D-alanine carboxypeptidase
MVAEAPEPEERPQERVQERQRPAAPVVTAAAAEPTPRPVPRPRIEAEAPLPAVARAYAPVATTTPIAPPRPLNVGAQQLQISGMRPVTATTTPSAMRWSIGAPAADGKVMRPPANVDVTSSIAKLAEPEDRPIVKVAELKVTAAPASAPAEKAHEAGSTTVAKSAEKTVEKAAEPARASESRPAVATAGKWIIQLGATDDEAKAKDILARARAKASGPLAVASGFTEKVEKGGSTLFRARFAGFEESKDAQNACAKLKRDGFACFATRG